MIEISELKQKKYEDIRSVDKSELTDIKDIEINLQLPVNERIENFLQQTANPYCQIIDGVIVKFTFSEDSVSLAEKVEGYIKSKFS